MSDNLMKSLYIKEQKRYLLTDLSKLFKLNERKTKDILKLLKSYGVLKIVSKTKDKKDKLSCVSCHKTVGHKNLGKILYEIKNPPVGNWDDEPKKDEPKK